MIAATNQVGYLVQRHDGRVVGWTAITEPLATRKLAHDRLNALVRTPGAEYRVYAALKPRAAKASLILAAFLCSACNHQAKPVHYNCSPAQRERVQVEAMRQIELINAWDSLARRTVFDAALARNCVVAP